MTNRELHRRANALAAGLQSQGVRQGDVVALLMYNCPEFLESVFAINKPVPCFCRSTTGLLLRSGNPSSITPVRWGLSPNRSLRGRSRAYNVRITVIIPTCGLCRPAWQSGSRSNGERRE